MKRSTGAVGLHDPKAEHDACGFGLIANLERKPSRWLVTTALTALTRMAHRGSVAADGRTGDGCGVLIHRPDGFLKTLAREAGFAAPEHLAAGIVYLPRDAQAAAAARNVLDEELARAGVARLGWRVVPLDTSAAGETALSNMPRIEQVFVAPGPDSKLDDSKDERAYAVALFLARRRAEQRLADVHDFYVVSLAPWTLGYKAMVIPGALPSFYLDLARPELESAAVVFHQRFSTNTAPSWARAQPFRLLAHNGEINTIEGNRRWAKARAAAWRTDAFDLAELDPPIAMEGSDSQSLDNMLELLVMGGMDVLHAMRILVPPATGLLEHRDPDLAAFYEYYALNIDLWDGPAGIVLCDDRYAACTLDRNGLRPARWVQTSDGHFTVASEVGVWDYQPEQIVAKGRLGAGEMLAIDLVEGRRLDSTAIDALNKARAPFKKWLKDGIQYLHSDLIDPALAAEPFDPPTLARFQKLFALSREEREQVLRVLAETEQEATGSMGDDTPMAVLSQRPRALYDHFRQAFAQV
ncbi:MAG TPA: glutamate synthase central domain-containing protein, partial [Xanthomonadales bacterium]|nr:glutamate synthase central domain-containing protein [Xanthomonadales bacterium]